MNQRRSKGFVDLVAKGVDMHVDNVADAVEVDIPNMLDNHRPRDRTMRVTEKKFQQSVFLELEIDGLTRPAHLTSGRIHFEISNLKPRVLLGAAPEQSADPCGEFRERERLDQVVVGAGIESRDFVFD